MAYLEREITILSPDGGNHFNQFNHYNQEWPAHLDGYDSDPLERVEKARGDRGEYYKRVESTSRNFGISDPRRAVSPGGQTLLDLVDDGDMVVREKSISDGGPSADSIPRIPQPHTSWRFYTSFDNGEWKRHMVPVYHSEKDVLSTSPSKIGHSRMESTSGDLSSYVSGALSPTFGLETTIRRMRINRPSVYEALQSRRRRTIEGARRLRGPRSPEIILNTSEYLPPEEVRRRYEVKDYVPKRRTEYGERVIYPRTRSTSEIETESKSSFSSMPQRTKGDTNFEEVTRKVHQPAISNPGISFNKTAEVAPANTKPINNYGYQEKVIIPTKYKEKEEDFKNNEAPLNDFTTMEQQQQKQQHVMQSGNLPDHDRGQSDSRRTTYSRERIIEPPVYRKNDFTSMDHQQQQHMRQSGNQLDQQHVDNMRPLPSPPLLSHSHERNIEPPMHRNRFEPDYRTSRHSRSLEDDEFESRTYREERGYEPFNPRYEPSNRRYEPSNPGYGPSTSDRQHLTSDRQHLTSDRSRDKSKSQEKEVKVVVINSQQQNQQQDRPTSYLTRNDNVPKNEVMNYNTERRDDERNRQAKSSRADVLASQVRSSTLDTMKQMESQMVEHMKEKCPEAADAMNCLVSGKEGKDMTMERKEAFGEQVSLWQGGRPIEEKLNREIRYRTNDPISGPQDFVERSSLSRGGKEMQESGPFIDPSFKMESRSRNQRENPQEHANRYRDSKGSYYSQYSGADDRTPSVFYPSGYSTPSRQVDVRVDNKNPYNFQGNQKSDYYNQQNYQQDYGRGEMAKEERTRTLEKTNETAEKIIIPTKYRQAKDVKISYGSQQMSQRVDVPERPQEDGRHEAYRSRDVRYETSTSGGGRYEASSDQNRPQAMTSNSKREGNISDYAAFISKQLDSSAFDEFDAIDRKLGSVPVESKMVRTRVATQGERPVEIRRMGSLHDSEPSGEWEFDMAVREIPRN